METYVSKSKDIRDYYLPEDVMRQDYHVTNNALHNNHSSVQVYDNHVVYFDSLKERAIDSLFRRLIDYCKEQGLYDDYYVETPIINPQLRQSFKEFVSKHSY